MGILPLRLPDGVTQHDLRLQPADRIEIDLDPIRLRPRAAVEALHRASGEIERLTTIAAI